MKEVAELRVPEDAEVMDERRGGGPRTRVVECGCQNGSDMGFRTEDRPMLALALGDSSKGGNGCVRMIRCERSEPFQHDMVKLDGMIDLQDGKEFGQLPGRVEFSCGEPSAEGRELTAVLVGHRRGLSSSGVPESYEAVTRGRGEGFLSAV